MNAEAAVEGAVARRAVDEHTRAASGLDVVEAADYAQMFRAGAGDQADFRSAECLASSEGRQTGKDGVRQMAPRITNELQVVKTPIGHGVLHELVALYCQICDVA